MEIKKYHCRDCKKVIIADPELKGKEWFERSRGYYYCKDCYEKFKQMGYRAKGNDDDYLDRIIYIITHDLKQEYNFFQIKTQYRQYLESGLTGKGIYLSFVYYFILMKNEFEPKYGIGIIKCIYSNAQSYWEEVAARDIKIIEQTLAWKKRQENAPCVTKKRKKKKTFLDVEDGEN